MVYSPGAGPAPVWIASADCYYLRLWIKNEGKTRAEQVQVFASNLFRRNADGQFARIESFMPMNLRWAHCQQRGPPEIFAAGISPNMGRHCDRARVVDPEHQESLGEKLPNVPAGNAMLALELEITPNTNSHLIGPGTYRLELMIAAANCLPIRKTVELTITGQWFAEESRMFTEGLGISVVR